jgi:hypothetical protein
LGAGGGVERGAEPRLHGVVEQLQRVAHAQL